MEGKYSSNIIYPKYSRMIPLFEFFVEQTLIRRFLARTTTGYGLVPDTKPLDTSNLFNELELRWKY